MRFHPIFVFFFLFFLFEDENKNRELSKCQFSRAAREFLSIGLYRSAHQHISDFKRKLSIAWNCAIALAKRRFVFASAEPCIACRYSRKIKFIIIRWQQQKSPKKKSSGDTYFFVVVVTRNWTRRRREILRWNTNLKRKDQRQVHFRYGFMLHCSARFACLAAEEISHIVRAREQQQHMPKTSRDKLLCLLVKKVLLILRNCVAR